MMIDSQTGIIAGRAGKPGVYAVVITAANAAGPSVGELALTVAP